MDNAEVSGWFYRFGYYGMTDIRIDIDC